MNFPRFDCVVRTSLFGLLSFFWIVGAHAQRLPLLAATNEQDADHIQERARWFLRGRVVHGKSSADLRHRAYRQKMRARSAQSFPAHSTNTQSPSSGGIWMPLGPVPLASNASGSSSGQDYHQVSGRATAVAIDPADPSGNTVYIGGAQGGVWKSSNAAANVANNVVWTPITDDQATLSI